MIESLVKEGPQIYTGGIPDPPMGSGIPRKIFSRPYLPKESIIFLRALLICSSLRYRKPKSSKILIFQKVVNIWKFWDFEGHFGAIWYVLAKHAKPLGFLSKDASVQMQDSIKDTKNTLQKGHRKHCAHQILVKLLPVLSVVIPVTLTSLRSNCEKPLNNYRYKSEGLL